MGGPKTIEEVHRDAYLAELEEKRQVNALPPSASEGAQGGGPRGGQSPMMNHHVHVPKKADWTTVQNKAARFQPKKPSTDTQRVNKETLLF